MLKMGLEYRVKSISKPATSLSLERDALSAK